MKKEELLELSDTLRGIAEGKEWEVETLAGTGRFIAPFQIDDKHIASPLYFLQLGSNIRLKQWSLPKPPEGFEWHREDGWTEEMLAGGYRPLLAHEHVQSGDDVHWEYRDDNYWSTHHGEMWVESASDESNAHWFLRTKRPLPTRKKKQKVPLGPADVQPGSVIRGAGEIDTECWCLITSASDTGIRIWRQYGGDGEFDGKEWLWGDLAADGVQIKRPGEDWQPCYKEVEVEA